MKTFEDIYKLNEATMPKRPFLDKLLTQNYINNEDSTFTVGLGGYDNRLDSYIDESLEEGSSPQEIADQIWNSKEWGKSFHKDMTIKDLSTYIFRREQKLLSGDWGPGDGENGQQLLPFGDMKRQRQKPSDSDIEEVIRSNGTVDARHMFDEDDVNKVLMTMGPKYEYYVPKWYKKKMKDIGK